MMQITSDSEINIEKYDLTRTLLVMNTILLEVWYSMSQAGYKKGP